jgi:hypothetical protein
MTETEHAADWARSAERSARLAARDAAEAAEKLEGGSMQEAAWAIRRSRQWAEHVTWCLDHAVKWGKRMEATAAEEAFLADGPAS